MSSGPATICHGGPPYASTAFDEKEQYVWDSWLLLYGNQSTEGF
jgi:hypothetical protein